MLLEINNLKKSYKNHLVLDGISFTIDKPVVMALVGPNGAGKSTLLNCITNILDYQSGQITILGKNHKDYTIFKDIAYLKDNNILYPYLTGYEHLKYIADIQKIDNERITEVSNKIGITKYLYKKTGSYSLGMKQHLLIAMSIMNKPKLILMDEPLTGLDPDSIIEMRELIKELHREGVTILISSHTLSEIDYITNNILFLSDGKVVYEDIEKYKKMVYSLHFNNSQNQLRFINALDNSEWIDAYFAQENMINININETDINKFMSFVVQNDLKLDSFISRRLGAESRYKEIYNV